MAERKPHYYPLAEISSLRGMQLGDLKTTLKTASKNIGKATHSRAKRREQLRHPSYSLKESLVVQAAVMNELYRRGKR